MSSVEELPSWASRGVNTGGNLGVTGPPPQPPRRRRLRAALFVLLGLLVMAGMAFAGYWFANRTNDTVSTEEATDSTIGSESETGSDGAGTVDETTTDGADGDPNAVDGSATGDSATGDSATGDEAGEDGAAATDGSDEDFNNDEGQVQHAVLKGGQVFLRGRINSRERADAVVLAVGEIVGPDNVIDEYEIDPNLPIGISSPLYVEDVVLFDFNSVEIEPAFEPILDLGTLMLSINPDVKIAVVARTDSVGSEEVNLKVAQQRADAVIKYWTDRGADPSRLIPDPRGEEEASGDEDGEQAALDRRVEFTIMNFLGDTPEG